jgi:two-component system OmpR family sensor kinase
MTLRLRLTIIYTTVLGITLVLFSTLLFVLLRDSLISEVDRVLEESSAEVNARLVSNSSEATLAGVSVVLFDSALIREFTTPGVYVQVLDARGRVVARSANLNGESLPISPDLVEAALDNETTLTSSSPGRPAEPLRILTSPIIIGGSTVGVLQVGASLYNLSVTTRLMLFLLSVGVLSMMLIVAAVIYLVTRRALRPLVTIANTAEYIGSSQDLSQRLRVKGPNDEIGRLGRAFNTMIQRLQAAFSTQKQFTADSSHELRTPLTVIRGNLDLLKRDPSAESRKESLDVIEQETVRMGKIVDDLMLLAQIDGTEPPQPRPVALDEVALQVYNQTRVLAKDRQVTLGHVDAVRVLADHDRLVQMLLNLADNAVKYTPAGGSVTIECYGPNQAHPGLATLSVRDTGAGIAAEDIPHIFDRFYRADKAHSRSRGGTGLGLAIVKSIAESYGGRVSVESVVGQGSTFTVYLPAGPS